MNVCSLPTPESAPCAEAWLLSRTSAVALGGGPRSRLLRPSGDSGGLLCVGPDGIYWCGRPLLFSSSLQRKPRSLRFSSGSVSSLVGLRCCYEEVHLTRCVREPFMRFASRGNLDNRTISNITETVFLMSYRALVICSESKKPC